MTVCLCEECEHETSDICLDETIALCLCCVDFDLANGDLHGDVCQMSGWANFAKWPTYLFFLFAFGVVLTLAGAAGWLMQRSYCGFYPSSDLTSTHENL